MLKLPEQHYVDANVELIVTNANLSGRAQLVAEQFGLFEWLDPEPTLCWLAPEGCVWAGLTLTLPGLAPDEVAGYVLLTEQRDVVQLMVLLQLTADGAGVEVTIFDAVRSGLVLA